MQLSAVPDGGGERGTSQQ